MNRAILTYLRQRQAQLVDETTWLRDRLDRCMDVHREDWAILEALGAELAQVTMLLDGRNPAERFH
jgi:hypothetical protein